MDQKLQAAKDSGSLRSAIEMLRNGGYSVRGSDIGRMVDRTIGQLGFGDSVEIWLRSAYGAHEDGVLVVGYTGSSNVGGRFYWTVRGMN